MKALTIYELAELVSCSHLQRFALPRAFFVTNLVVDDLSVLSVGWRRLPSHHDALKVHTISHKHPVHHYIQYICIIHIQKNDHLQSQCVLYSLNPMRWPLNSMYSTFSVCLFLEGSTLKGTEGKVDAGAHRAHGFIPTHSREEQAPER